MTRSQLVAALVPETGEQHHHKRRGRAEEKHHWRQEQHQESVVADSVRGSQSPIYRRSPYKKVGSEKLTSKPNSKFRVPSSPNSLKVNAKVAKFKYWTGPSLKSCGLLPYVMYVNVRLGKIHPQLITCPAGPPLE